MTIHYIWFLFALFAVFLIPGKTNVLLAHTAHHKGIISALALLPAEYLGYFYAIGLWSLFIHTTTPYWTRFDEVLHVFSIGYVLWVSLKLWKTDSLEKRTIPMNKLSSTAVFYATLRNPKAILFTVGIFPSSVWFSTNNYLMMMLVFGVVMIPSGLFWIVFGKTQLMKGEGKHTRYLHQMSAFLLILCTIPVIARFFMV